MDDRPCDIDHVVSSHRVGSSTHFSVGYVYCGVVIGDRVKKAAAGERLQDSEGEPMLSHGEFQRAVSGDSNRDRRIAARFRSQMEDVSPVGSEQQRGFPSSVLELVL
ncbi:hypothetical protein CP557_10505 [Natrinema ejinorense]|uniref:Uncharacterized protein n=1 Tax=Natrinema ejinorense TaxID=373386 RepID=A0A2A5QVW3_9EURY|nr:hypothetical protein CP557_10505 [Natrinema ejinorense]